MEHDGSTNYGHRKVVVSRPGCTDKFPPVRINSLLSGNTKHMTNLEIQSAQHANGLKQSIEKKGKISNIMQETNTIKNLNKLCGMDEQ